MSFVVVLFGGLVALNAQQRLFKTNFLTDSIS